MTDIKPAVSRLSILKVGVLLSAAALLISLFACTDAPRVSPETDILINGLSPEPRIKMLIAEAPELKLSIVGPFEVFKTGSRESDRVKVFTGNKSIADIVVKPGPGGIQLAGLKDFESDTLDFILLSESEGSISVGKETYYGTIRFTADQDGVKAVYILPVERYLYGVVAKEMGAGFPDEALKAQAIAARNYALFEYRTRSSRLFHVYSTTQSQAFTSLRSYPRKIVKAVDETRGMIMTYNQKLFKAYYSATCGGQTAYIEDFWDVHPQAQFTSVKCTECRGAPFYEWSYQIKKSDLRRRLLDAGYRVDHVKRVNIKSFGLSGRVRTLQVDVDDKHYNGQILLAGRKFRTILGGDKVRSTWFQLLDRPDAVTFSGQGWGHGVGLCQNGARGRAEKGRTFKEILTYYYTGVQLKHIY